MKRLSVILAAGLLATALPALAACAAGIPAAQPADRQYPGLALDWKHADSAQPDAGTLNPPYASWLDGRAMFVITTYGSATCPLTPAITGLGDERTIELVATSKRPGPSVCLANYTPTTFVFTTPSGVAQTGDVQVVVTWESVGPVPEGTTSGTIR